MAVSYRQLAVSLGELKTSHDPLDVLVAYGLGSCLAISMYDPGSHTAGMLHAVLPENERAKDFGVKDFTTKDFTLAGSLSTRYVDSGIMALLGQMLGSGAHRERLIVKLAGGAKILATSEQTALFNIGSRNIAMAYQKLASNNIRIAGKEIGGNVGRTVRLYVADGRFTVSIAGQPEQEF